MRIALAKSLIVLVTLVSGGLSLSGCALGPFASSDGAESGEYHSRNCAGLAIERHERLARISNLERAMQAELTAPPATLVHAMQRIGAAPETGTTAYGDLSAERNLLAATTAAAERMKCPAEMAAKLPQ